MTYFDHVDSGRRGFLGALAGVAALAASAPLLDAGTAWADGPHPAGRGTLPAVGQEIECASQASGVVLHTALGEGSGNFDCYMRMRVEADPKDRACRRLRMLEHRVTGQTDVFGQVILTQDVSDRQSATRSTLRLADRAKPRYELRMVFPRWDVEIGRVPVGLLDVAPAGPIRLVNTNPLVLENTNLSTPMPHGESLTVQKPMRLAHPSLRGLTLATIDPFTVRAHHVGSPHG